MENDFHIFRLADVYLMKAECLARVGKFSAPGYLRLETTPDYRKLFPIPYKAWQSNDKLVQNPGWLPGILIAYDSRARCYQGGV